jgi:hypothetical protein
LLLVIVMPLPRFVPEKRMSMNGYMLKTIGVLKEMAAKGGVSIEKAINMVEVLESHRHEEQDARRSLPEEKELVRAELAKLDATMLRKFTSREIAAELIKNGVTIRPNVQGVLSVISRTRKLLTSQSTAAAA